MVGWSTVESEERLENVNFKELDLNKSFEEKENSTTIVDLLNFPFGKCEELGSSLARYNNAIRINIIEETSARVVRNPSRFLILLKQLRSEASVIPSYGLKIKTGNRIEYVHFLLELNEKSAIGVFFYDSNRILSVPQIHNVERLVKRVGLSGAIIVANQVGIPAKQEAQRINDMYGDFGILTIEHFNTIEKRFLSNH